MSKVWLTTWDNEWDPFEHRDEWLLRDIELGYNCCERVGRIAHITDQMSDEEIEEEEERAIDAIVLSDPFNLFRKVRSDEKFVVRDQKEFLQDSNPS